MGKLTKLDLGGGGGGGVKGCWWSTLFHWSGQSVLQTYNQRML